MWRALRVRISQSTHHSISIRHHSIILVVHLLSTSIDINFLPQPSTKVPYTEPIDATLHKNSIEPRSIRTLNIVHRDYTNLPPIPPSLTPEPCENWTQFKSLNLHRIFGCMQFRNQKHRSSATNASLVNPGLISFATIVEICPVTHWWAVQPLYWRRWHWWYTCIS